MPESSRSRHNHRKRNLTDLKAFEPRDTLLMADQGDDAEPVIVHLDGESATLELVDGQRVTLDRSELLGALGEAA